MPCKVSLSTMKRAIQIKFIVIIINMIINGINDHDNNHNNKRPNGVLPAVP